MNYRALGRSGLRVSELCLGTMIFGEESQRSAEPDEAIRMVHRFIDRGGNHIDTANVYADGRSEEIVGEALRDRRDRVVLATKVRFRMGPGPNDAGLSRRHIFSSVEGSLRRLKTDYLDLLYMHCSDPFTPIEESLGAFDDLVREGKVRYIGLSNFKAWRFMKALATSDANHWSRFVAAQYQYSLVVRDIEREFIDLCEQEGVGMVPWGPLGGGFLSGKYRPDQKPSSAGEGRLATTPDHDEEAWDRRATDRNWTILDVMEELIADRPGATYSQIAIAWLLAQPAVSSVVIGARNLAQLDDNLEAVDLALRQGEIKRLTQVSGFDEGYPYRYLKLYGGSR
ncbi:MAG: aldo/keto reductase [Anaerolineales bacterium]|nr:aldo/keto reductase [Anaerolineales bacterium]